MKKIILIILTVLLTVAISGCTLKKEESTPSVEITEEMQALIGTYTEDGSKIVGFDDYGWPITEAPPEPEPEEVLGFDCDTLLQSMAVYDRIVITDYIQDNLIRMYSYTFDPLLNLMQLDKYTPDAIERNITDLSSSKAVMLINNHWCITDPIKVRKLAVMIPASSFTVAEDGFTYDDSYVYITGTYKVVADSSAIGAYLLENCKGIDSYDFYAIYDRGTRSLELIELKNEDRMLHISAFEHCDSKIALPDLSDDEGLADISTGVIVYQRLNDDVLIAEIMKKILEQTETETVTDALGINPADVRSNYPGIQVSEVRDRLELFLSSELTLTEVAQLPEETLEDKAVKAIILDTIKKIDESAPDDTIAYYNECTKEKIAQAADVSANEEELEETSTEETEDTTPKEYAKVLTTVNVRKGPGTGYAKVTSLKTGDRVQVLDWYCPEDNGWAKCYLEEFGEVYISNLYIVSED